jgi:pyridoxal 5'-phosphate synthase pdxS subunit
MRDQATSRVTAGLAEMLNCGVIIDPVTAEEAKIAAHAGAVAVTALKRVPSDIRRDGGVARMSDPAMIRSIQEAVTIPVMASPGSAISPRPRCSKPQRRLHRRVRGPHSG